MKVIGIVGTRKRTSFSDYDKVKKQFEEIYEDGDIICSGGCPKGADAFAEELAKEKGIPILIFYPNWAKYKRGAGVIRNSDIARSSTVLIACVTKERTGGTEDTIRKFEKQGKGPAYLV